MDVKDLLEFLQQRMAQAYTEQVWTVAIVAAMCGFVVSKREKLIPWCGARLVSWGVRFAALLAVLFIWSRHGIYVYYNRVAGRLIASHAPVAMPQGNPLLDAAGMAVGWSGVLLYSALVLGSAWAAVRVAAKSAGGGTGRDAAGE